MWYKTAPCFFAMYLRDRYDVDKVEFPDLSGCVTGGKNLEEAMEMAVDAASGWVLEVFNEIREDGSIYRVS